MPSGWNIYYIVFFIGALSLAVPAFLACLSFLFSGQKISLKSSQLRPQSSTEENPTADGKRTNFRAFSAVNSALAFMGLALLLLPCAIPLSTNPLRGLICVLSLCLMATLSLLYGIRKKDLDWLMTFRNENLRTLPIETEAPLLGSPARPKEWIEDLDSGSEN